SVGSVSFGFRNHAVGGRNDGCSNAEATIASYCCACSLSSTSGSPGVVPHPQSCCTGPPFTPAVTAPGASHGVGTNAAAVSSQRTQPLPMSAAGCPGAAGGSA